MPSNEITFICGIQKYNKLVDVIKKQPHRYSEQLVVTRGKGGQDGGGVQMVKGVNCMVIGDN